jgi:DNA polymerase V
MGFPSPAADYVQKPLDLNDYLGVTPGDTVLVDTNEGYALLSKTRKPKQGDTVLIQFCGSTQFAKIMGRAFITEDGEAIEGDALDDVVVIGKVTFQIISTMQDDGSVI